MTIETPVVVSRKDWGAKPFEGTPRPQPHYKRLTLHHAAGYDAQTLRRGKARLKEIQTLHQGDWGWSDIGYHFLIDAAGNIYQGRPYMTDKPLDKAPHLAIGAHVQNHNTSNIGVCLLGCFHPLANPGTCTDVLTEARQKALVGLFAFLCARYDIAPSAILGHGDQISTDCPGENLRRRLEEIRLLVKRCLDGHEPAAADHTPLSEIPAATDTDDRWTRALKALDGDDVKGASATTAAQDRLAPGVAASHAMANTDLQYVLAYSLLFSEIGELLDFPPAVLAAIASRESRCGAVLSPEGWGDNGNAFGIMQVDKRYHRLAPGGFAGRGHILQATEILSDYRKGVSAKHPKWKDPHVLKGAVVAYNSGVSNVQTIKRMDFGTTGNDYGSDTIARAQFFLAKGI